MLLPMNKFLRRRSGPRARRAGLTLILLGAGFPILLLVIGFAAEILYFGEPPVPPVNVSVEVINQSSSTGTLQWQSAAGSGRELIEPCQLGDAIAELGSGAWQVTISEGSAILTTTGNPPVGEITYEYFGISADGVIRHLGSSDGRLTLPPRLPAADLCTRTTD